MYKVTLSEIDFFNKATNLLLLTLYLLLYFIYNHKNIIFCHVVKLTSWFQRDVDVFVNTNQYNSQSVKDYLEIFTINTTGLYSKN